MTKTEALARVAAARREVDGIRRWMHAQEWPTGHPERPRFVSRLGGEQLAKDAATPLLETTYAQSRH